MAKETKYSVRDLKQDFPNDEACLIYLFETRHSYDCSCGGKYRLLSGRQQFQCSKCRWQIAPMAGTIFEKSTTPLTLWFHAIFIFSNAKSGISAKEMERQLGVTYKTAWRMLKLIRASLKQSQDKLDGTVEVDEAFFGGHGNGGTYNKNQRQVMKKKAKVIAAIERGGNMKAKHVTDLSAMNIWQFLDDNIKAESTRLMTDQSNRYDTAAFDYKRESVNHSRKQFVCGDVHVNNVEWFWSHVKKSIKGTFKSVSKKELQSYLDVFVWHYNNRHNDRERFASLLGMVVR